MILRQHLAAIALTIGLGALGGWFASLIGAPMPFLLGSLLAAAVFSVSGRKVFGLGPALPMPLRSVFIAVIGVMIGGSFKSGFLATAASLWVVALAVILFVFVAFASNYLLFRWVGKIDKTTAFFASMPGGAD